MKTSKKVLGVVLTLIMLVNVFAVSVFAAYPDDAAVALIVKTDKTSYSAGETVKVTVSAKALADVGSLRVGGQHELAYNAAGLEPLDASKTDNLTTNYNFVPGDAYASSYNNAYSQVVFGGTPSDGNGWTDVMTFAIVDDGSTGVACADSEAVLFSFDMKVPAGAADGTYSIGFNRAGYEDNWTAYAATADGMDLYGNDGSSYGKTNLYDFGVATFTVGKGGGSDPIDPPAATLTVENLGTKVRWATPEEDSRKDVLYVGFEGKVSGLTDVSTLSEIGFKFSTSDATLATSTSVKTFVIYDFTAEAANTYKFRSIVRRPLAKADIDGTNTFNIYAQAYVVVTGVATPITASNPISTTLQAEYQEGVANQMEDRFA